MSSPVHLTLPGIWQGLPCILGTRSQATILPKERTDSHGTQTIPKKGLRGGVGNLGLVPTLLFHQKTPLGLGV